jgi:hypothetical protein
MDENFRGIVLRRHLSVNPAANSANLDSRGAIPACTRAP